MDVAKVLSEMGVNSLSEIMGKTHLLTVNQKHQQLIKTKCISLNYFTTQCEEVAATNFSSADALSPLNQMVIDKLDKQETFVIRNTDRAVPATLCGLYAQKKDHLPEKVSLTFKGSAGQGFGVFNVKNVDIKLEGEANDSVAKGMSGGTITIVPPAKRNSRYISEKNSIIGNCALYGATGGTLFVHGKAGDRFAVRNSGATAIVESVGLHACEYMSGGCVWILDQAMANVGAGMSGGVIYMPRATAHNINSDYVKEMPIHVDEIDKLTQLGREYFEMTKSESISKCLEEDYIKKNFVKIVPKA
jgi:glutamate synthase domain-containing protein 3